jgi:hypothetical protein
MGLLEAAHSVYLFDEVPPVSRAAALEKYRAWTAGQAVDSNVAIVGSLALTLGEKLFLQGARILAFDYTELAANSVLRSRLVGLHTAFMTTVIADMERSDLDGRVRSSRIFAGRYGPHKQEPWHSDDHPYASIRYTASFGAGATRFAIGEVSKKDIAQDDMNGGDLLPHITVGPEGRLQELPSLADGKVARFMNIGDIHAGPYGSGARVLLQATVEF